MNPGFSSKISDFLTHFHKKKLSHYSPQNFIFILQIGHLLPQLIRLFCMSQLVLFELELLHGQHLLHFLHFQ